MLNSNSFNATSAPTPPPCGAPIDSGSSVVFISVTVAAFIAIVIATGIGVYVFRKLGWCAYVDPAAERLRNFRQSARVTKPSQGLDSILVGSFPVYTFRGDKSASREGTTESTGLASLHAISGEVSQSLSSSRQISNDHISISRCLTREEKSSYGDDLAKESPNETGSNVGGEIVVTIEGVEHFMSSLIGDSKALVANLAWACRRECAVCLGEYAAGERIKVVPACAHGFHADCIDLWLAAKTTCPICRQDLSPGKAAVAPTDSTIQITQEGGSMSEVIISSGATAEETGGGGTGTVLTPVRAAEAAVVDRGAGGPVREFVVTIQGDEDFVSSLIGDSEALVANLAWACRRECAVCLGEYAAGERIKVVPACAHGFHADCIDLWLAAKTTCPICRQDLSPGKASTDGAAVGPHSDAPSTTPRPATFSVSRVPATPTILTCTPTFLLPARAPTPNQRGILFPPRARSSRLPRGILLPPRARICCLPGGLLSPSLACGTRLYSARACCLPAWPPLSIPRVLLDYSNSREPLALARASLASMRGLLSPPRSSSSRRLTRASLASPRHPLTSPHVRHSPPLASSSLLTSNACSPPLPAHAPFSSPPHVCDSLLTLRAALASPHVLPPPHLACFSRLPARAPHSSPCVLLSPPRKCPSLLTLRAPLASTHVLLSPHQRASSSLPARAPLSSPRVILSPHRAPLSSPCERLSPDLACSSAPLFPLSPSFSALLHFSPLLLFRSLLLFPPSASLRLLPPLAFSSLFTHSFSSRLPAHAPLSTPCALLSPPLACSSRHPSRAPLATPRVLLSPPLASSSRLYSEMRVLPHFVASTHHPACAPPATPRVHLSVPLLVLLSHPRACSSLLTLRAPLATPRVLLSPPLAISPRTGGVLLSPHLPCSTRTGGVLLSPHLPCSTRTGGVLLSPHLPCSTLTGQGAPLSSPPVLPSDRWGAPLSSPPVLPSDRAWCSSPLASRAPL
ncbi:unnamed protein product [Closterium sp. Yama58-4]|nr:unnamed protein product [Closterium sp. Yama58-4]